MHLTHLENDFAISKQLVQDDFQAIAAEGFGAIICNRPDGEQGDYVSAAQAAELANAHGLEYLHIPVAPDQLTDEAVALFKSALAELPGPIVAHCGTGKRSSAMWALSKADEVGVDAVLAACADAGHDLAPLRPRLAEKSKAA